MSDPKANEVELNPKEPSAPDKLLKYLEKGFHTFFNPIEFNPNKYFSVSALRSKEPLWGRHLNIKRPAGGPGVQVVGRQLTDDEKLYNMLGAVASKSVGATFIAAVAHLALRKAKNRKQQKNLRSYLNAAYPMMSLDPSTRDPVREEKEELIGIRNVRGLEEEQNNTASGPTPTSAKPAAPAPAPSDEEVLDNWVKQQGNDAVTEVPGIKTRDKYDDPGATNKEILNPITTWLNELLDKAQLVKMPGHPVLSVAVPLAVAYSTYKGLDKVLDKKEKVELEGLNARKRNMLQAMMYKEFQRTRNKEALDKEALLGKRFEEWGKTLKGYFGPGTEETGKLVQDFLKGSPEIRKHPSQPQFWERLVRHFPSTMKYGVPAAFTLWAIASTALAYSIAKSKFDKGDPRRKRMKQIQRFLRRRAVTTTPPMFLDEKGFPVAEDTPKKKKTKKKKSGGSSVSIPEATEAKPEEETLVDTNDPYAALLS